MSELPQSAGPAKTADGVSKPPKPCCACPETRQLRDNCVLEHGEDSPVCAAFIRAHNDCLRAYGFSVSGH